MFVMEPHSHYYHGSAKPFIFLKLRFSAEADHNVIFDGVIFGSQLVTVIRSE